MTKEEFTKQCFDIYFKLETQTDESKKQELREKLHTIRREYGKTLVTQQIQEQKSGGRKKW